MIALGPDAIGNENAKVDANVTGNVKYNGLYINSSACTKIRIKSHTKMNTINWTLDPTMLFTTGNSIAATDELLMTSENKEVIIDKI